MIPLLLCLLLPPQFDTTLEQSAVTAFETYAKSVEQALDSHPPSVYAAQKQSLFKNEVLIRPGGTRKNPIEIPDGLIHDWTGTIFFPNASMERVLAVLQDFDHHAKWYPEVLGSRLVRRSGNDLTGYWRLEKKEQLVDVVFDVTQEAHWQQVGQGRWICRAYAKDVREVRDKRVLPIGEGLGVFWRGYYYWSLESANGGVIGELRTLSLSRAVPTGLGWVMKSVLQNVPRESLRSTLQNTRKAVTEASASHPSVR